MAQVTGHVATEPDFAGSTPRSLWDRLLDTSINGLNAFIDLELAERFGVPNTQADALAQKPAADQSNPKSSGVVDFLQTGPGLAVALLALAGGAFLLSRVL